jgi:ankyrin repeat protein
VVELLLAHKALVNVKTKGWTPLHSAAEHDHKEVAKLLLVKGAEANTKDNDGCTPLHVAAQKGYKDIVELLRQHGGQE